MLCLNVSYIAISTIKRVVSEDSLLYYIDLIIFKTQELCEEAVDDSLAALKLIPDSFVTIKRLKKKLILCMQMKIYSTLMKILVTPYLFVKKGCS